MLKRRRSLEQIGLYNKNFGADKCGFQNLKSLFWNLLPPSLYEQAIINGEAEIASEGALLASTGNHTGRSPKDKFIVKDDTTKDVIWWSNNGALSPEQFGTLHKDFLKHAEGKNLFAQDLYGGSDPQYQIKTRIFTELAWHSLFIRNMLIRPQQEDLPNFIPELTIIDLPSFKADPERHGCRTQTIIACNFSKKIILIGGSAYAGEIKKSVFTYFNYILPEKNVMPMHCSANAKDQEGNESAVFFGLSGTGKTTLSADPKRILIGDDEHGWSPNGIFNIEGGCYAKTVRLSREAEPEIYATTERFGTILENTVYDHRLRVPDFNNTSITENTRCAYPLHFIPNASQTARGSTPKNIVMLTCDAFGILPPIARLSPEAAMYHFLSGYTAKVAGTEQGINEPEATFSTCFGAPFMPRKPAVYGKLLGEYIQKYNVDCWLVNTGWTGGKYGIGHRMPIKATRTLLTAALNGSLSKVFFRKDELFGFDVPLSVECIDPTILTPIDTWSDRQAFTETAHKLVTMFQDNFKTFEEEVSGEVRKAAPKIK